MRMSVLQKVHYCSAKEIILNDLTIIRASPVELMISKAIIKAIIPKAGRGELSVY